MSHEEEHLSTCRENNFQDQATCCGWILFANCNQEYWVKNVSGTHRSKEVPGAKLHSVAGSLWQDLPFSLVSRWERRVLHLAATLWWGPQWTPLIRVVGPSWCCQRHVLSVWKDKEPTRTAGSWWVPWLRKVLGWVVFCWVVFQTTLPFYLPPILALLWLTGMLFPCFIVERSKKKMSLCYLVQTGSILMF